MAMELDYDYLAKLVERTQMGDSDAFAELYCHLSEAVSFCLSVYQGFLSGSGYSSGCLHSGTEKYSYTEESTTFRVMAPPDYIPHLFRHHSEDEAAGTGYSVRYI